MKKIGNSWNRENVTVYGRALVSNTLIMPVILYRARVNAITRTLEKEIQKTVKDFLWRKVPSLKWSIAVRGIQESGRRNRSERPNLHDRQHKDKDDKRYEREDSPTVGEMDGTERTQAEEEIE